jgi:hypothetical protein
MKELGFEDINISAHIALSMICCETEVDSEAFYAKAEEYVAARNKDFEELDSILTLGE